MRAPAASHAGRPAGNSLWITHSLNGSVGTGAASTNPVAARTDARCSSVVAGVIRSTMVVPKATFAATHPASVGSTCSIRSATTRESTSPLCDRLSQETIARGPASAARRASSPATILAGVVVTGAEASARSAATSATTALLARSMPPSGPRR